MLTASCKKYITSPIIAMLPFVIYILLQAYVLPTQYALGISLAITFIGECIFKNIFKSKIYSFPFYVTAIALIIPSLLWIIGKNWIEKDYSYIVIGEITIIMQLMLLKVAYPSVKGRVFKKRGFLAKALLDDYYSTLILLKYALLVHVLLVLGYKQVTEGFVYEIVDHLIYVTMPLLIMLSFLVYQFVKTKHLSEKLQQEEWLPIVTEGGEVKGRIARVVSRNMKNKHLHPVVRIALICGDKIYLQERDGSWRVDPKKLDYPFEKYVLFKHDIVEAAITCIQNRWKYTLDKEPEFVVKYVYETEITKRLVFLFTIMIDDENDLFKSGAMQGKFWTIKQIDNDFGSQIFSECFELEYEYLKHSIILKNTDEILAKNNN